MFKISSNGLLKKIQNGKECLIMLATDVVRSVRLLKENEKIFNFGKRFQIHIIKQGLSINE